MKKDKGRGKKLKIQIRKLSWEDKVLKMLKEGKNNNVQGLNKKVLKKKGLNEKSREKHCNNGAMNQRNPWWTFCYEWTRSAKLKV